MVGTLRQQPAFPLSIQCLGSQNLVRLQNPGDLARSLSINRQVKDTLDHRRGILVNDPVVTVGRVEAVAVGRFAHVLAAGASGFQNRTNLFTGIFGIKIVKKITKRREIVISPFTVHSVIDGDEADIITRKNNFCILAHLQVISAKSAHIFNNPCADQSLFHQGKPLLDTGAVEVRSSVPIVHQNACVCEATFGGISGQDSPLIGNRI